MLADLKKTPEISNTPILVCSIIQDKTRGFSLGAADYLVKPITEDELRHALERVKRDQTINKILVVDDEPSALQSAEAHPRTHSRSTKCWKRPAARRRWPWCRATSPI